MRRIGFVLALGLMAAPVTGLVAQTPAPRGAQGARMEQQQRPLGDPVARILEKRTELKLTAEQVTRLESIDAKLREQNQPLMQQMQQQMQQARGERPQGQPTEAQREEMRKRREQMRPVMEKMRANQQAAMKQVQTVLTAAQKEQVQSLMREQRGERGERGEGRPQQRRAPATR